MLIEIISAAPVLNSPDFRFAFGGENGRQIPTNALGHPLYYEFVALPHTRFRVEERIGSILRVSSPAYPESKLYIDQRFTRPAISLPPDATFPTLSELAVRMKKRLGTKYVWGGNWSCGVPEMLTLYPPQGAIDEHTQTLWTLRGLDCSGLLYEASGGLSPRNTSDLVHFGQSVPIEGKTKQQILDSLELMDMIVWPGHVWFVLDSAHSIESKSPFGVICRGLSERFEETLIERRGVDLWVAQLDPSAHFVIRRLKEKTH